MTSAQIELVQVSFKALQPNAHEEARIFYDRLFEIDPSLRSMFRGDMPEQGRKLMQMMGVAIGSLRQFDQLLPAVEELGRRHAAYGVRDEHYSKVATALMWTLNNAMGDRFTVEICTAWTVMYEALSTAMQRGAAGATSAD